MPWPRRLTMKPHVRPPHLSCTLCSGYRCSGYRGGGVDITDAHGYDFDMTETEILRDAAKSTSITKAAAQLIPRRDGDGTGTTVPPDARPIFARASGAVVTDVDGNDYIDFICGHGSQLLGHGDDRIIAAITKATSKGCALGETTEARVRLAELIVARFPAIDMVQFTSSRAGSLREVQRLARTHTGRSAVVIPERTRSRRAFSNDDGIIDVPFADINAMDAVINSAAQPPAAVLVEPIGTDNGVHPPPDGYLLALRDWCDQHGALLVFDEAVTALRMSPSSTCKAYEAEPDLTCFGSSITGGMAAAAYGGRRKLMQAHAACAEVHMPLGDIGHEPSLAAGVALLQATAEEAFHQQLEAAVASFERGLIALPPRKHVAVQVHRTGSLIGFGLAPTKSDAAPFVPSGIACATFLHELMQHGVLFPMKLPCCLYVTSAHTEAQLTSAVAAVGAALDAVDHALD